MSRRLVRVAARLITLLPLVLFLATALLWVRSYIGSDRLGWTRHSLDGGAVHRRGVTFRSGRGGISCDFFFATDELPPEHVREFWESLQPRSNVEHVQTRPAVHPFQAGLMINPWTPPKARASSWWERVGFSAHLTRRARPAGALPAAREQYTTGHAAAPLWFPFVLFGILPAAGFLRRWRHERAVLAGRCPDCGYDTRATPGVCPECGRDPAAAAPPRLVFHSRALAAACRAGAIVSAAACGCLLLLVAFAAAAPWFTPMRPAAARQMFFLDTYVPASPPVSLVTLVLATALLPALRLAASARSKVS